MDPLELPVATYRLQFQPGFGFFDAKAIVPYLRALGISHIYAAPIFKARAGSTHGYDIVDPNLLNPELGSPADLDALLAEVRRQGMGWIQDIVPNHMAYDSQNQMLMDVLESGKGSPFYDYFDIDWSHPYGSMKGRVLAPFLARFYGECLERGEIKLSFDARGLSVNYFNLTFPVNIESYGGVFSRGLGGLRRKLGSEHPDFVKLLGVLYAVKNLPAEEEADQRPDQIKFVKKMLWELYVGTREIKDFIDANVARLNGNPQAPESFNALEQLLAEQLYRLAFWKVAAEEINYRRFFTINELISVRVEDARVFERTHALILELARAGKLAGLRVDHIDGLYDPAGYLDRLRREIGTAYLTVEKILGVGERLPTHWPVQGTTGYDFLNYVNGLFCDSANEREFSRLYADFTGTHTAYKDLVAEKKRLMIGRHMAGDIDNLAHLMKSVSSRDREGGDITLYGLKRALVEVLTYFPVYRTYISQEEFTEEDRLRIQAAVRQAKDGNPGLLLELDFIEKFLLLDFKPHMADGEKKQWIHFVMRLQQLTGPLMAKGFEDTTLYVFNRLLSLNTVGGDPGRFGLSLEEFHGCIADRAKRWPHSMNATSTHDEKRGEDARARINVLSEIPAQWERRIHAWSDFNRPKKTMLNGKEMPDRNDEYFLYQSLVGAFPVKAARCEAFVRRVQAYMIKAVREAKEHTAWLKPDEAYEQALASFIERILEPEPGNEFFKDLSGFAREIAQCGVLNSLSQTLLKIAAPGVPDFYQGTDLWELSFVDPDNRRPVDFATRGKFLRELEELDSVAPHALITDLFANWSDGRIKLYVAYRALKLRREENALFDDGRYIPLYASGKLREHVCAFARNRSGAWALTATPRLTSKSLPTGSALAVRDFCEGEVLALPPEAPDRWINVLTDEGLEVSSPNGTKSLELRALFQSFPVALLRRDGTSSKRP